MAESSSVWGFTSAFVVNRDRVYVLAQVPELENLGIHVSEVFRWTGEWGGYRVGWPCTSLCGTSNPEPAMLCMGIEGRIHVASATGFGEESVDNTEEGPAARGVLRDMRVIGDHVYVAGMGRQVYRRDYPGKWSRIDAGVVVPRIEASVAGFNSIDGFSEHDIYAVGWGGEMWRYNGRFWRQLLSPTSVKLQRVLCVSPNRVFACGQLGVLLRGFEERWDVVEHATTRDQFWGMEWFLDRLWVATQDAVYYLEDDGNLVKIDFGVGKDPITCGWLHANDGSMWSVGGKHLLLTTDGNEWRQLFVP